jgi:hypothetical protein
MAKRSGLCILRAAANRLNPLAAQARNVFIVAETPIPKGENL